MDSFEKYLSMVYSFWRRTFSVRDRLIVIKLLLQNIQFNFREKLWLMITPNSNKHFTWQNICT